MSARPLFWPASRAAARRRVSRRGFFFVAGAHLAGVMGVFLLSMGPAKITVAAGRKSSPADEAPALTAVEERAVVWMDPASFEAPPAEFPAEPPAAPPEPPRPAPPGVRETLLAPTPRPKPAVVVSKTPKKSPPHPPAASATKPRPSERPPPAPRPRPKPVVAEANPTTTGNGATHRGGSSETGAPADHDDPNTPAGAGGTDWYASMLHERFHARWEQPTSVFASAQRYVATLRLRIERDGRISDFRLVRSSGLVPMDESVLAAAARVGRVDPPPSGLLRGGAYVVNVGFVRE